MARAAAATAQVAAKIGVATVAMIELGLGRTVRAVMGTEAAAMEAVVTKNRPRGDTQAETVRAGKPAAASRVKTLVLVAE